jgi:hypothetical protein
VPGVHLAGSLPVLEIKSKQIEHSPDKLVREPAGKLFEDIF